MARFLQLNASGAVTGHRQGKTAPQDSDQERFIKYDPGVHDWGNFWGESKRNGLRWPDGSFRYVYNETSSAPELQADTTNYIRVNPDERGSEKGVISVVRFVWLGTTGSRVEDYQGVHYASIIKDGDSIPVRLIFDGGRAVLREQLEPGWYRVTPAADPEDPTNKPALKGETTFAVYLNAGDPAGLGL